MGNFLFRGARYQYCFHIIDPAAKHPYSRRTSVCGRVLARVLQNVRREMTLQNQMRLVRTNGEKHA